MTGRTARTVERGTGAGRSRGDSTGGWRAGRAVAEGDGAGLFGRPPAALRERNVLVCICTFRTVV